MKPDPEHDGSVRCTDRIYRIGELNQCTIASQLGQPAAMARQYRLQAFGTMELEASKRTVLVASDQARVASDIRRQNSCQSADNPFSGHGAIPQVADSRAAALYSSRIDLGVEGFNQCSAACCRTRRRSEGGLLITSRPMP